VDQDAHRTFIDDGVELFFLAGGNVEAIVIEGEEPGIIVPVLCFSPGDHQVELFVGVEVIIVVGDRVLDEAAYFFYLFRIFPGFFGGQRPVLEFGWFFQVIGNPYLSEGGQRKNGKDSK